MDPRPRVSATTRAKTGSGRGFGALMAVAALLLLGACSQPSGEEVLAPFYLDTYGPGGTPTAAGPRLAAGVSYVVSVEGTHSSWGFDEWLTGVCHGEPEDEPMYPSPTVQNGMVGMDAVWVFAVPNGSSRCGNITPFRGSSVRMSLNGGATFQDLSTLTEGTGPTEGHRYEYEVTGQGMALVMNRGSGNSVNNYGRLLIEVRRVEPQ